MKHSTKMTLVIAIVAFLFAGCQKDYQPTGISELNYDIAVPIGHASITLGDLMPVDNSNIIVNPDSSITFYYRQDSLFYFSVADLIEIPSQPAESKEFKLGEIAIDNFGPISSDIKLSDLLSQLDTNAANFIESLDGTNSNLPGMTAGSPQSYAFSDFDDFEYVTFSSGGLVFSIVNNLKVDFTTMDMTIFTINNGTEIEVGSFQINNLPAGGWQSDTIYLDGVTLYNNFAVSLNSFSTAATTSPVPVNLDDQLYIGISSYDLKVIGGKAKLPQQQLEGLNEVIDFGVSEDERITTLSMLSGQINYSIQSSFAIDFNFNLQFPTATQNGSSLSYLVNTTTSPSGSFDLSGAEFDFASSGSQPYNQLPVSISFAMAEASQWVEFDSSSTITFTYGFENLQFDKVEGWVGNKAIDLAKDTIPFDIEQLANLSGVLEFENPEINLLLKTNIGIPVGLTLGLVNHSVSGATVDLGLDQLLIPYPTIPGNFVSEKIAINNSNSNLSTFLSTIPKELFIEGRAATNPNSSAMNPDYTNFITSDAELSMGIEIELPFALRMQDLRFKDTVNVNLNATSVEGFQSGLLSILTSNGLPFDIDLNLVFFDSITNLSIDTIVIDMLDPAIVDANGIVTQASEKHFELELTSQELTNLTSANKVAIDALVNTSGGGTQHVTFYTDYVLDLKLGLRVQYDVNLDN